MIHETAIIDRSAKISGNVDIGPYCIIGKNVSVAPGSVLKNNVTIEGNTAIGKNCKIWPYASVGASPQDLSYSGENTFLEIGDNCMIREYVTISRGTLKEDGVTRIGNDVLLMACSHIGHDCKIGNHVVIANYAGITGHVTIGNHAIVGGLAGAHQFVRIGESAMVSGGSMCNQDIFPFSNAQGDRAHIRGLNMIGMRRRNFTSSTISLIKKAFNLYFRSNLSHLDAVRAIQSLQMENPIRELKVICDFITTSKRSFARPIGKQVCEKSS